MKRSFLWLMVVMIGCVVGIVVLAWFAALPRSGGTGFTRIFPPAVVEAVMGFHVKYPKYYIAGIDDRYLYLGNYNATAHVLKIALNLADTQHIALSASTKDSIAWGTMKVAAVDDGYVMMDRATPQIVFADSNGRARSCKTLPKQTIVDMLTSDKGIVYTRTYDLVTKQTSIKRVSGDSMRASPLDRQTDGFFDSDGTMMSLGDRLVYVYRYRNRFEVYDSSLNRLYTAYTRDTNSLAKVSVATAGATTGFNAPPLVVNKFACIADHYLLVASGITADNEDPVNERDNNVIDVYHISNGAYISSFYLPKYRREKLTGMSVSADTLFAVYETYLYQYRIKTLSR